MWIHFLTSPRDTNTRRGLRADVVDVAHAVDVVDHGGQRKDSKVRLAAPLASPAADHGTQPAAAAEQAESLSSWAREVDAMPAASRGEAVVRFVDRSLAEDKSVPMEVLVQYVCLGLALGNGAKTGWKFFFARCALNQDYALQALDTAYSCSRHWVRNNPTICDVVGIEVVGNGDPLRALAISRQPCSPSPVCKTPCLRQALSIVAPAEI